MNETFDPEIRHEYEHMDIPSPRPNFFEDFDARVAGSTSPKITALGRRRTWWLTSLVPAAAAVIALVMIATNSTAPSEPFAGKSGIELVSAKIDQAFAATAAISGTAVIAADFPTFAPNVQFTLARSGDSVITTSDTSERRYSAQTGAVLDCQLDQKTCTRTYGHVPGDQFTTFSYFSQLGRVRSVVSDKNVALSDATFNGKSVWKLSLDEQTDPMVAFLGQGFETYLIDKATGFPVSFERGYGEKVDYSVIIHDLKVISEPARSRFELPNGFAVVDAPYNGNLRITPIGHVNDVVGYAPIAPKNIPSGYERAEVLAAKDLTQSFDVLGAKDSNGVVITYRSGLNHFAVSTRSARLPFTEGTVPSYADPAPADTTYHDPVYADPGTATFSDVTTTLSGGMFADAEVHVVTTEDGVHVWGVAKGLVFAVYGDLSDQDTLAAANSLQAAR